MDEYQMLEAYVIVPQDTFRAAGFDYFKRARQLVVQSAEETIKQAGFKIIDYDYTQHYIEHDVWHVNVDEFGEAIGEPYKVVRQRLTWKRRQPYVFSF